MDPIKIVSQLYELLASSSTKELESAAIAAGRDSEIGRAIMLLAKYRKMHDVKRDKAVYNKRSAESEVIKKNSLTDPSSSVFPKSILYKTEKVIFSDYFSDNKSLAKALNALGMSVKFNPKEGRKKMYLKFIKHLESYPYKEQKMILSKILSVLPKSETSV